MLRTDKAFSRGVTIEKAMRAGSGKQTVLGTKQKEIQSRQRSAHVIVGGRGVPPTTLTHITLDTVTTVQQDAAVTVIYRDAGEPTLEHQVCCCSALPAAVSAETVSTSHPL